MKINWKWFLFVIILPIFIYGCNFDSKLADFYLAGDISTQSPSPISVYIAFYSKDSKVDYDSQGSITGLDNFSIVGGIQEVYVLSQNTFQIIIPMPYYSIGGILAWIDTDENSSPDPSYEEVILAKRVIDGKISIITGINYDDASQHFTVYYEKENSQFQNYLTIIGLDNYQFEFQ